VTVPQSATAWLKAVPRRTERADEDDIELDDLLRDILDVTDGETSLETMVLVLGVSELQLLRGVRRLFAHGLIAGVEAIAGERARSEAAQRNSVAPPAATTVRPNAPRATPAVPIGKVTLPR
jgi:hypothetical protein